MHGIFPSRLTQGISRVEVVKRNSDPDADAKTAFSEVELRIGNADESVTGETQFADNPRVGYQGAHTTDKTAVFDLAGSASGRYLTLQRLTERLAISEVYVTVQ